jgi:hypothetical protein
LELEKIKIELSQGQIFTAGDWLATPEGEDYIKFLTRSGEKLKAPDSTWDYFLTFKGFKVEYCKEVFSHMKRGKSYNSFGATRGILPSMKKRWEKEIPHWRIAKVLGEMAQLEKYEDMGLDIAEGTLQFGNAAVWKTMIQTQFRDTWGEKKEVAHSHLHGGQVVTELKIVAGGPEVIEGEETFVDVEVMEEKDGDILQEGGD